MAEPILAVGIMTVSVVVIMFIIILNTVSVILMKLYATKTKTAINKLRLINLKQKRNELFISTLRGDSCLFL